MFPGRKLLLLVILVFVLPGCVSKEYLKERSDFPIVVAVLPYE